MRSERTDDEGRLVWCISDWESLQKEELYEILRLRQEVFVLEHVARHVEQIDRGISTRMLEFPATSHCVMARRNFLTLQPDAPDGAGRYWANWWVEGEPHPYTKVIHPAGAPA